MLNSAQEDAEHIMQMVKSNARPDDVMREINKGIENRHGIDLSAVPASQKIRALCKSNPNMSSAEIAKIVGKSVQFVSHFRSVEGLSRPQSGKGFVKHLSQNNRIFIRAGARRLGISERDYIEMIISEKVAENEPLPSIE